MDSNFTKSLLKFSKCTLILIAIASLNLTLCIGLEGEVLIPVSVDDPVDPLDGLDLAALQSDVIMPVEANINAEKLRVELTGVVSESGVDVTISVNVTTTSELPADSHITFLIFLDTDLDSTTGEAEPEILHNGIGAEYNLGFIAEGEEIIFATLERYNASTGTWENVGGCTAELGASSMRVDFMRSQIGDPERVRIMAYIIEKVSEDFAIVDMITNYGVEPPEFGFEFEPLAEIEAPSSVTEGSETVLDGSQSFSFEPIVSYSWDLDGDGVFDLSSPEPTVTTKYMDDAVVDVTLKVETASGLADTTTHRIIVVNVPPSEVSIVREGSIMVGEESIFYGYAVDQGLDDLSFTWDFGGGETADGEVVGYIWPWEGEFTVILTVTDDDGGIGTAEMVLTTESPPPPPPLSERIEMIDPSASQDQESGEWTFQTGIFYDDAGTGEMIDGILKLFIDDQDGEGSPIHETPITLVLGNNSFSTSGWEFEAGEHVGTFFASFEEGATIVTMPVHFEVEGAEGGPDLLLILLVFFGFIGVAIYIYLTRIKSAKNGDGKEEEEEDEKDFCEEHPEVVEQEDQACWDAQLKLSDALGSVRDQLDAARPKWRAYSREVGRLLGEWDSAVAVIAKLTEAESELYKDAAKVQEVAGLVTSASSKAKTAFKKGGEAAMKEVGKDFAKDVAKGIAGEVSQFAADLLSLEEWAKSTIGIGFAKLVTGIDPKKEASALRAEAEKVCDGLRSWVDRSEAWNQGRRPPDTLQSCLGDMQKMYDAIGEAEKEFNDAVANFRCVECEIPEELLKLMDKLARELEDWMKAFGDMIDQVEQRLKQALKLFNRKDVYEHPYQFLNKSRRNSTYINRALGAIAESKS